MQDVTHSLRMAETRAYGELCNAVYEQLKTLVPKVILDIFIGIILIFPNDFILKFIETVSEENAFI